MNNYKLLLAPSVGFFLVILDISIVNIALYSIQLELKSNFSTLQWIVDAYTLSFASLLLTSGYLGLRFGAKNIYLLGLSLFVMTSIMCGCTINNYMLIYCRLFQGIAAALIVPSSLTLVHSVFEDEQSQTRAIAIWASIGGIAAAVAPIIGSLILIWLGWRYIFFINVPIGLMGIYLTTCFLKIKTKPKKLYNYDTYGQMTGILSIATLTYALIEAGKIDYHIEIILIFICLFIALFILFLKIEYSVTEPIFPLEFFKSRTFFVAILIGIIINLCGYGILFLLPLFFQKIKMYSILASGLALTPFAALAALGSLLSGKIANRFGHKIAMILGLTMASSGFFMLLLTTGESSYWKFVLPLIFIGAGGAMTMPAITLAAMHSAPKDKTSIASGILNTSRQIGSLMGVAIFGSIVNLTQNFTDGLYYSTAMAGSISLLGLISAFIFINL